jgi:plastocyanin
VRHTNISSSGIGHNIDFHAVTGPGGGAPALYAEQNETKTGVFRMLYPGLFMYHCAAAPVPMHIANGMYGLLLVEPEQVRPFTLHTLHICMYVCLIVICV